MSWDSTNSTLERDGCCVAAVALRSRATPQFFSPFSSTVHSGCAEIVSIDPPWRSRIPRIRESAKCGTGFAVPLDRRGSRPASALVHEETQE